eukprot:4930070-Alexandrium_andersonii.AAC.1
MPSACASARSGATITCAPAARQSFLTTLTASPAPASIIHAAAAGKAAALAALKARSAPWVAPPRS